MAAAPPVAKLRGSTPRVRTGVMARATLVSGVLLGAGLLVASVLPLGRFAALALERIRYPFELEWMEGQLVTHIGVVLGGGSLYREPSFEFTPFIYTPAYYYVSALVSLVTGLGYFAPRLVSLVSILASFVLLGRLVRLETKDTVAGVAASGMLAATYALTEFWFDIARVDSMLLALVLSGYTLARTSAAAASPRRAVLAGAVLALACLSKQVGLTLSAPALAYVFVKAGFRKGALAAGAFAAVLGVSFAALELSSHGWFHYYVIDIPARHAIDWPGWQNVVQRYFWTPTIVLSLSSLAVVAGVWSRPGRFAEWILYGGFVVVACATSLSSMLHTGGYPNTLIPAYASMSLAFGLVIGSLRRTRAGSSARAPGETLFALLLVLVQTALLDYDPAAARPTAADRAAGRRLITELSHLQGPLWMSASSFYPYLAGHREAGAPVMSLVDVFKANDAKSARLRQVLFEQIRNHHYKTIVLDRADGFLPPDIGHEIRLHYRRAGTLFRTSEASAFWPKSGAGIRPDEIWVAR